MFERVIDHLAVHEKQQMEIAIAMVAHAKNSHVKQHGRTAFQAAFGRVPMLRGELMSDTTNLQT